jgi:hypothetical protein
LIQSGDKVLLCPLNVAVQLAEKVLASHVLISFAGGLVCDGISNSSA